MNLLSTEQISKAEAGNAVEVKEGRTLVTMNISANGTIDAEVVYEGSNDRVTWAEVLRVKINGSNSGRMEFPLEHEYKFIRHRTIALNGSGETITAKMEALK